MDRELLLGDVAQREVGNQTVIAVDGDDTMGGVGRPREIVVRQHHTLWRARRSRRVYERRQAVGFERLETLHERRIVDPVTPLEKLLPGEHHRVVHLGSPAHRHDVLEMRQFGPDCVDLLQLRLVLNQDQWSLSVVRDVLHLFRRVRDVDARRRAADRHAGEIHDDPLWPVEPENRHVLTWCEPESDETLSGAAHLFGVLPPRGGPVLAGDLLVVSGTPRPPLGLVEQSRRDGVCHSASTGVAGAESYTRTIASTGGRTASPACSGRGLPPRRRRHGRLP